MSENQNRWLILFIALLASFSFLFSMQAVPPMLPTLIEKYGVSHARASNLMSFVALPAVFFSILGGGLINKYGIKSVGVVGLLLVSAGSSFFALPSSFFSLELSRLIVGIGGAFIIVAMPTLLAQWFTQKEIGLAMGIHGLNMPLATIISFNALGIIGTSYDWRTPFFIVLLICVIALVIFGLFSKERYKKRIDFSSSGFMNRQIWVLGFIWATFNMAVISFLTWSPKIFRDFWSLDPVYSDFLGSIVMIGALITPLAGHISDRLRKRRQLMILSSLGITISLLLLPNLSVEALAPGITILGLIAAFMPPLVFTLPVEITDEKSIGPSFGVLNTCLNIGIIAGPLITGFIMDLAYDKMLIFFTMTVFAFISLLLSFILKPG